MEITITLTDEEAAALWDDHHRQHTVAQIIEARTKREAQAYIRKYPTDATAALTAYKRHLSTSPTPPSV